MVRRKPKLTILDDPRYTEFCVRYYDDLPRYVMEHASHAPTFQQMEMLEACSKPGCRVAVSSGHGTGKSLALAWILDWNLRVFRMSNALLTANNVEQVRSVVWKYLDQVQEDVNRMHPWMAGAFVKETRRYYAAGFKDSWYVVAKTAGRGNPEAIAGQHNRDLMIIVDEASGVDDAIIGVLRGALTQERNRFIMTSQPTRPAGHFADAMQRLSKDADAKTGIYDAIWMNSEESPLVTRDSIREKLLEYGGFNSPEYQVKALGHFPDNAEGYLIPRHWCVECQEQRIEHEADYGFVICADVAEGMHRDSSVLHVFKVSGSWAERRVESVRCEEFLDEDEKQFARMLAATYREFPAATMCVDGDGAGRGVILDLEEQGIPVEAIHWGLPCHTEIDRKRYFNQRALAHYRLREAIFEGRFRGPRLKKFVEQASRLPYRLDERGRYQMLPKEQMRAKGIKSPDICDTCCFAFLADFTPVVEGSGEDARTAELLKMAREAMGV